MNLRRWNPKPGDRVEIVGSVYTCRKQGTIEYFDPQPKKWKIDFGDGWVGWYNFRQLKLIGE